MFDSFRGENGFTFYPNHESPNSIDKPLVAVTYFCVLVAIATLLASFGVRGKEKWYCAVRASYSVAVGSIILACIVSHSWREGHAKVVASPYVYRADLDFHGELSLKIGLHTANVTLKGSYSGSNGMRHHVNYVEALPWADYGEEREAYQPILRRGLPEPVLKVMEFLTMNKGGMRWGPSFHSAGQTACALLWTAFAFWVLTNVLLFSVVIYGAYLFFFTGFALLMSCVAYHSCQNDYPFIMLYGNDILELSYGWSFWLTLVTGTCTTALGAGLILMDHFLPETVAEFFHLEKPVTEELPDEFLTAPKKATFTSFQRMHNQGGFPYPGERRGSIFLEPERQRNNITESLFKKKPSTSSLDSPPFINKAFEGENGTKINPLFVGDKVFGYTEEERRLAEMEKVCERGPFHLKDPKASLATLKELRDNHTNERKSTSFGNGKDGRTKTKKDSNSTGTSSLQSSPRSSRLSPQPLDLTRPRSESVGASLSGHNSLKQYGHASVTFEVGSSSSINDSRKVNENVKVKRYEEEMNARNTLVTSKAADLDSLNINTEQAGLPHQFEVEVETHHSSCSEVGDVLSHTSVASDDTSDTQSLGYECECESKEIILTEIKCLDKDADIYQEPVTDKTPSTLCVPQEVDSCTIQVEL